MVFTSQSRLCTCRVFHHVFFFPSGPFLRTFILAWFLQYFERLGAPRSAKRPSERACFRPWRSRCPKESPWRAPRGSQGTLKAAQGTLSHPPRTLQRLQNGRKTEPKFDESMKNAWLLPVKIAFAHFLSFNMFFSTSQDLL